MQNIGFKEIYNFCYCDPNDRTYKKRYSVDKIHDYRIYDDIMLDEKFKTRFRNNFNLIYNINDNYCKNKNISATKKVLIVSYIFPPIGGGGVQRTLKFVKYLREYGWEPIVLTVGNDFGYDNKDNSLIDDIPEDINIIRIDHNIFNSEQLNKNLIKEFINLIYGVVDDKYIMNEYLYYIQDNNCSNRNSIFIPDICVGWVNNVLKNIVNIINFNDISLVYTSSSPYSDHIIGYYLKRKYNIPWVADFRDEWTNHAYYSEEYSKIPIEYKINRKMEENIVNLSDAILTVTPICVQNYINNFNLEKNKVILITNGYDESDFSKLEHVKNDKFTLIFNGSLYKEINPLNIILSINQLIDDHKINVNNLQVRLIGTITINIKTLLYENDKYNIIKYCGYLSHNLSLRMASSADILLLILGESEKVKSVYTGKLFEYLRLYKPILALSPKGSLVDQLLNVTKSGKNFEYDDINGIKEYILNQYRNWKDGIKKFYPNKNEIEKYERKNLTKELAKVFNDLIN